MNNTELKQAESFLANVIETAQNNAEFRSNLVANPKKTIKEEYGLTMKPSLNCVVEDQTDSSVIYLNIPKPYNTDEVELTEEQLEKVSGGELSVGFVCGALLGGALYTLADGFIDGLVDGFNGTVDSDRAM